MNYFLISGKIFPVKSLPVDNPFMISWINPKNYVFSMAKLHKTLVKQFSVFANRNNNDFSLAIMFSQLKVPPPTFREWMLSCDSEYLKDDFLKQLEKYLPTAEELKTLADLKDEANDLQYSEQYFCAVSSSKDWMPSCTFLLI